MLEKINLDAKLPGKEFARLLPQLQRRLYDLEKACWDNQIASIFVFEGWDAAGKGSAISTLTSRLDARGYKMNPIQPPRTFEQNHPWLWRFWLRLPNYGEMAIFDRSWYMRVLDYRVEKLVSREEWRSAYQDIADFERSLADDGVVIVKFWMHISKKEQKKRFKQIEKDPLESWRITADDWVRHRNYNKYLIAAEEMMSHTDAEYAPWVIVEATSRGWAQRKIFETMIGVLEQRLGKKAPPTHVDAGAARRDRQLREAKEAVGVAEEAN
jgi:polyphosphate kinase 2 (PPK2 family)